MGPQLNSGPVPLIFIPHIAMQRVVLELDSDPASTKWIQIWRHSAHLYL